MISVLTLLPRDQAEEKNFVPAAPGCPCISAMQVNRKFSSRIDITEKPSRTIGSFSHRAECLLFSGHLLAVHEIS